MVNLALGSSEKVLRSREPNFILESLRFDEVLVEKVAPDAAVPLLARPVSADLSQRVTVPRVRHWTHTPDPPECVRSLTQRGLQFALSPDAVWVRHRTLFGASGAWRLQVQLAVNGAPDALRSASGATLSASGALVFYGIRVAGPWT